MTVDIFIKTYPVDYPWIEYCLRSIDKFATGFRNVVTVDQSESEKPPFVRQSVRIIRKPEYGEDGYLSQQVFKLCADEFTDADYICYIDSDTIFTRPVTPETYFQDGLPIWLMTPYEQTKTPWQPIIEKFIGLPLPFRVEYEFMRRSPILAPRWLLQHLRMYCELRHHMSLKDYVMSQPYREYSEFNAIGALAYYWRRENFHWIDTSKVPESEWPALTVLQSYSWGGLTDEIRATMEEILK